MTDADSPGRAPSGAGSDADDTDRTEPDAAVARREAVEAPAARAEASRAEASRAEASSANDDAPDPVIGIGLVILGVLVMGIAGAATLHYVFNIGTAIAIVGAIVFLVCVAMSSLKERKLRSS
ncbi:MAG: hypothetical protein HOW73_26050 [Polyangiaceae bacterium]|nr:hypothetical protein [Polyangiaceae bacterium]